MKQGGCSVARYNVPWDRTRYDYRRINLLIDIDDQTTTTKTTLICDKKREDRDIERQ